MEYQHIVSELEKAAATLLAPPNPSEMITKRQIFDHMYSLKITPGKCRSLDYQKHVLETVLCFKNFNIHLTTMKEEMFSYMLKV